VIADGGVASPVVVVVEECWQGVGALGVAGEICR